MNSDTHAEDFGFTSGIEPYKSYIKTILGKVYVTILDPYTGERVGLILKGDPKTKHNEDCIVDVWSQREDAFFHKRNKKHFELGQLIEHTRKEVVPEESEILSALSDDEMVELLNSPFFKLQATVNKMETIAPIYRLIELAKEQDKSPKILDFLAGKMSELQLAEYETEEEE